MMDRRLMQAIRLVLVQIHQARQHPRPVDGGLWVSASVQNGLCSLHNLSCTVAVAGLWGSVLSVAELQDEVKQSLASFTILSSPTDPEELSTFTDNCGTLHLCLSFQVRGQHETGKVNWSRTEQFLRRLSLVHAQVDIYFTLKINEVITKQVFRGTVPVGPGSKCTKIHPVPGTSTPLLLPPEVAEMCGVISLLPVGALSPCLDHLLYGPSNLPMLREDEKGPSDFLCSLTYFLPWEEFGLSGVQFKENIPKGAVYSDIVYTVDRNEQRDAVKQALFLFLFLQQSDPFHCQLSDFTDSEDVLMQNLDSILQHNREIVKSALHSILISTLSGSLKRKKAQEKIQTALPVIFTSLSSVVNSSTSLDFRTSCLKSMKVQDTKELRVALQLSLWGVVQSRSVPSRRCSSSKRQYMTSRSDGEDAMVSKEKGKERKKHQLKNICDAHSCPEEGLSVEMPKIQESWKSYIHKRPPELSNDQSGTKQRTAPCLLQLPLGGPAAPEHMEATTWLRMFEWD